MKVLLASMLFVVLLISQEKISVKGKITSSEDGSPIIGATVLVMHTTLGTSTDNEGRFQLKNVPSQRNQLQISAVGFKTTTVTIHANEELVIMLVPSPVQTQGVVVTANKRQQSLEEIPVSMSVIDAKMFERKSIVALDDALRYVPGVNFQQWQINIRASSGYSRGVGSRVSLLIDGMPLLTGDTGEISFETIPVFQIDRVEVVKGAGSTLYGSGALGGVINVLTKKPEAQPTLFWRMYTGFYSPPPYEQWKWTDKTQMTNGQLAGFSSTFDNVGVTLSFARYSDDGYRESDWRRRYNGYVKLAYELSPYQSLSITSNFYQQYRADFIWWKDLQNALRPADDQRNSTVTSLRVNNSLQYRNIINEDFYVDVKGTHYRGNWHQDSIAKRINGSISDAIVGDIQGNYTLARNNILTFGVQGNYSRTNADIFGIHEGRGAAVYLQNEYIFSPELSATAGIRHDIQEVLRTFTEQQTNPKLGVRYTLSDKHTVRFSTGRGFRTPSISELYTSTPLAGGLITVVPNTSLQPERSWTYELSSTHTVTEHLQFDLAFFHNDFYDLIEPEVFSDPAAKIHFRNITQAKIQGFEASVFSLLFEHSTKIHLHYNYNWAEDKKTGSFLRFRPRHVAGANLSYVYQFVEAGADYRFVSKIEEIDNQLAEFVKDGTVRVPISVLDLYIVANLAHLGLPCRASLNINNATGYNYNELIGNVSPPRNVVLSFDGIIQ